MKPAAGTGVVHCRSWGRLRVPLRIMHAQATTVVVKKPDAMFGPRVRRGPCLFALHCDVGVGMYLDAFVVCRDQHMSISGC